MFPGRRLRACFLGTCLGFRDVVGTFLGFLGFLDGQTFRSFQAFRVVARLVHSRDPLPG